jgi:hypothetical protein
MGKTNLNAELAEKRQRRDLATDFPGQKTPRIFHGQMLRLKIKRKEVIKTEKQ